MNMLNAILGAQGGQAVGALSQQFGLSQDQTVSALTSGQHGRYLEDAGMLGTTNTVREGNAILGHILGSPDVSRAVATNAASSTGIGPDVLKKMLPVVATLAMGALAKQATTQQLQPGQAGRTQMSDNIGSLASFLDVNRDGSVADDMVGFVGKLFGGR